MSGAPSIFGKCSNGTPKSRVHWKKMFICTAYSFDYLPSKRNNICFLMVYDHGYIWRCPYHVYIHLISQDLKKYKDYAYPP